MEQAFADCGLEPRSVYLDTDTLRGAEGASPFSWDVEGKRNVVAGWTARGSGGRSLILNGHVDLVPPATTATTDARHFVRMGIPAVCFGPRGERIHGIDERVSLRSVVESAQVLGLFVRDWCGLVPGRKEES
jgi:acetylornithine deacetylase/succinyl-diaminopimelate desuccinylase-like protein